MSKPTSSDRIFSAEGKRHGPSHYTMTVAEAEEVNRLKVALGFMPIRHAYFLMPKYPQN